VIHVSKADGILDPATALQQFVQEKGIKVLNVAGPRGSNEPEVGAFVKAILERTWPQ
jgi:hypothetical protein